MTKPSEIDHIKINLDKMPDQDSTDELIDDEPNPYLEVVLRTALEYRAQKVKSVTLYESGDVTISFFTSKEAPVTDQIEAVEKETGLKY